MNELQQRMSATPNFSDFEQLWRQTVSEFIAEKSSAIKLAKMLVMAEPVVPRGRGSLKAWAENLMGKKLGSAMANGYKAYKLARNIVCWSGTPAAHQIDEKTFDSLGIIDCVRASTIITMVLGMDNEQEVLSKLCSILRHKNAIGGTEKQLIRLLAETRASMTRER